MKKNIIPKKNMNKIKHNKKKLNHWKLIAIIYVLLFIATVVCFGIDDVNKFNNYTNFIKEQQTIISNLSKQHKNEVVNEIEICSSDRELIARLLYHEGRGESFECQCAIVSVIVNRLNSGIWGNTFVDVIYAKNQFEPVLNGKLSNTKPLQQQYDAVDYVIENGVTVPEWVQYFRAEYHFKWSNGYTKYMNMNNTYFGGYR